MIPTRTYSGRDSTGTQLDLKAGAAGAQFTADLSAIGTQQGVDGANIFAPDKTNILNEERRLIEKVFSIVDKDQSGSIDANELRSMFQLFGVETNFLNSAIDRVMANLSEGSGGMISPEEFYKLLSAKFSKGDSEKEMEDVFDRMGAKVGLKKDRIEQDADKELGIEEMFQVAQKLGETEMTKKEIKDMIRCFKRLAKPVVYPAQAAEDAKKRTKHPVLRPDEEYLEKDEKDPQYCLTLKEFVAIMNLEL